MADIDELKRIQDEFNKTMDPREDYVVDPNAVIEEPVMEEPISQDIQSNELEGIEKELGTFNEAPQKEPEDEYDELAKYKKLMEDYEAKLNQPKEEVGIMESLPDILAGAHNIMNYSQGSPTGNMKLGHTQRNIDAKSKARQEELGGLEKLQGMQQKYQDLKKKKEGKAKGKVYQTRSGLVRLEEDGTVTPVYKDPFMQSSAKVREESLGLRQDKFSDKKVQKQQDDAVKAIDSLRKTETWKSAEKAVSNIPEITVLLDDAYKEGGQSLAMLGPRVAKGIAGEVGVLTEQDVTRYVKNPELVGGMLDTLSKLKSGKITEASYENLKRLLDISKQTARAKLDSAIDREAILLSRREKIPFEDAKYLLDSAYKTSPSEKVDKKDIVMESKVQALMDRNKGLTRERAIKALKSKGLI